MLKELREEKEKQLSKINDPINTIQKLLEYDSQEDRRILTQLSSNSNFVTLEYLRGKKLELEKLEKEYGEVFHIDQIKEIAIN